MTQTPDNPGMISARRTESLDAPNILCLVNSSTEALFGRVNVVNLIERALLAITLNNEGDEVLAHAAFLDYPNVNVVEPAGWFDWFSKYHNAGNCTPLNSVFLHYFVAKPDYSQGCARELIRTMFNAIPEVHYCLLAVPHGVELDESLSEFFVHYPHASKHSRPPGNVELFVAQRYDHVPMLHIRQARVEDHDDLVPIFNQQSAMLSQTYGEYFLAELIEAQDDNMKCLVAEVNGTAVGFMSLSRDINFDLLNTCFELVPFNGLHVPHSSDVLQPQDTKIVVGNEEESLPELTASDSGDLERPGSAKSESSMNIVPYEGGSCDPVFKRKLSDNQRPGSSLSDNIASDSAVNDAFKRKLSSNGEQSVADGKLFSMPPEFHSVREKFIPYYGGRGSAFSIQLFCIDEQYEMRSCDFLPEAFSCFRDCDYCIITLPHLVPEFPLLQQFVHVNSMRILIPLSEVTSEEAPELALSHDLFRITPKGPSTLAQELYVFASSGLTRNFRVRTSTGEDDLPGVKHLVHSLMLGKDLLDDFHQFIKSYRDDDGTEIQVFIAEAAEQIVGVSIVRREENIEYIRSHYNIEDFIYYNHHRREEHGHLYHFALNPIFKHFSKIFLKEILRLGHKTSLYYPLFPAYTLKEKLTKHSLIAALNDMVPVRARRQIQYPVEKLGINAPSKRVLDVQEQFALNHINRKLVLEPKVTLNVRVVVVGASEVGMSFLETLAFCPHLRFNNLTLISPHGIPGELPPSTIRDGIMSTSHGYGQDEYDQMALRTWVNVVCGKMTAIDRKKKHVIVNGSCIVPYDHLVLCTGTQYQLPKPTRLDTRRGATNNDLQSPLVPQPRFEGRAPVNAFTINDAYDAAVVLHWIENNVFTRPGNVILYGSTLDVYCCVNTLLEIGLPGNRIVIVQPPTNSQMTCFNNPTVEKAVYGSLEEAGVQVYTGYILAECNEGNDDVTEITSASFTSNDEPLTVECVAFFSYYAKFVDYDAFTAMNCACLVYDGRLVVDTNFHTNDASVRGAGPLTKYQRIYHTPLTHADFNSKEIGNQLATALLTLFDPTAEQAKDDLDADIRLVPIYRKAKIYGATLPGGYHYLHVEKPVSTKAALSDQLKSSDYGAELITGSPGGSPDYFRLHINQYNSIETITCLSRTPIAYSNLLTLYGIHQRYLNNLVSRFYEGLITDFYSYFSEPWAMAIMHDRFSEFRDEIREMLVSRSSDGEESFEEIIRQLMDDDSLLTVGHRAKLESRYMNCGTKRAVETHLLSYINYNYYHLPMYAKPGMI